jgi:anti-anti-sigma factor
MYEVVPSELRVLYPRPGTAVVEVLGEQDLATVDETARLFAKLVVQHPLVAADLSAAQFIDSSFLKNLKNAQQSAQELGHTVLMQVNTEPMVRRILEVMNFFDHFDHVSTREEALAWAPD